MLYLMSPRACTTKPNDISMKHFVLSLAAAIAVMTSGLAQCMADFDFGDAPFGISPDPALDETFAEGTVGMPYDDTLHILMPTLASDLGGDLDLPIPIDSIVVQTISLIGAEGEMLSIEDLGLTLTPNNNGDSSNPFAFLGGNQYCATISGTPNAAGVFTASISVRAYPLGGFEVPYEFQGYTLTINPMPGAGCTDETACNYNPQATEDDGTCGETDQANDDCAGALSLSCGESLLMNNEECANVDEVQGCAASAPQNSTPGLWFTFEGTGDEVTVSTCLPGTNFDTFLSVYEGTCGNLICVAGNDDQSETTGFDDLCPVAFLASTVTMNTTPGVTNFVLVSGVTGVTGDFEIGLTCVVPGCTDPAACNYDAAADEDDGSCVFAGAGLDCEGNCLVDEDGDGICDPEVVGCTDVLACNYVPEATEEDGSCDYFPGKKQPQGTVWPWRHVPP